MDDTLVTNNKHKPDFKNWSRTDPEEYFENKNDLRQWKD